MLEHVEPKPKTVKIPGPDHPISVERNASRVVVTVAGRIVADTRKALTHREASYPPIQYIPRKDFNVRRASAANCSSSGLNWRYTQVQRRPLDQVPNEPDPYAAAICIRVRSDFLLCGYSV